MRKVSFDIKQNSKPSKLCILFRIALPKRFTSPPGTFWIERHVFCPPPLCLTSDGPAPPFSLVPGQARDISSWARGSVCLPCTPCSFSPLPPQGLHTCMLQSVSKPCQSTEHPGDLWGGSVTTPYAYPGLRTPLGTQKLGISGWDTIYLQSSSSLLFCPLMEPLLPTNSLKSSPLLLASYICPGEGADSLIQRLWQTWLAVPPWRYPPEHETRPWPEGKV